MKQRAELTFKHNRQRGRHGWLRLTPAYSVKVVEGVLDEFGADAKHVFEPFGGSGTTALCAASRGLSASSFDINPFLVWFTRVKTRRYARATQTEFSKVATSLCAKLRRNSRARRGLPPPIKNVDRWWPETELRFLCTLFHDLSPQRGRVGDLLRISFCRSMITLSNAAFNHQSMSFSKGGSQREPAFDTWRRCVAQFESDAEVVGQSLLENPQGHTRVCLGDSRRLELPRNGNNPFDLLVTSPPYPNRMSYVRELRPYMYWLGYLEQANQAGELDWDAIGGTWGVATSRLSSWEPTAAYVPGYLEPVLTRIRRAHHKNGELMARYVHKYFDDMAHHFELSHALVTPGGSVHYIIGNSIFYGHLVPAERLYVDQLKGAGFKNVRAVPIRKRNSKKRLLEFHVMAQR
jgi:hypothetical protein